MRHSLVESGDRHVEGRGGERQGGTKRPQAGLRSRLGYINPLFVFPRMSICELRDMNLITGNPGAIPSVFAPVFAVNSTPSDPIYHSSMGSWELSYDCYISLAKA